MDTQEKKKRTYKVAPAPAPAPEPASDPPKKKRVAKVAPVVEAPVVEAPAVEAPVATVVVEEPKKKRSYKVKNMVEEAPLPQPIPEPAPVLVEEPKKKRSYKVKTETVIAPPVVTIPEPVVVVEEAKKKRSYKVRPEAAVVTSVVTAPVKKERKKRVVKVSQPHVAEQLPIKPKAIESSEAPLLINDEDVITINVRKFEHNGKYYFLNSTKDKLYTVGTDGQPFQYHGRYNRDTETIDTEFGDSDAEY